MKRNTALLTVAIAGLLNLFAMTADAADYADPTWPCIQRKVETLSPALMWSHPLPETPASKEESAAVDLMAERLTLRRSDLESLRPEVQAFAERYSGDPEVMGRVFQRAFKGLDTRRTRIIKGIADFSLSQIALAKSIENTRSEMDTQMAADEPDFDRVDELEEKLDWDQLIYSDRQKSITYLCETPQLIERRLFGIAQLLAEHVVD
ncbi:hypothetical protein [Silicimonas algicola]|uniref:Uncharacterized protein n=1 Tax=Silicimonas algicola TaxID=1826607 RepID=A0A316G2L2_9RHOB|nr:hypothetical protein [Silicimonas algicola]PWK55089.1 hypothetical protein C8D95_109177 [Silicimonas algicola]